MEYSSKAVLTKRIDLNLGYTCNISCRFCYYQKSVHAKDKRSKKDLTTDQAKKWLLFFRKKGIEKIDLTGGEPTIRKDIAELIRYSKEIGYKTICIITNGMAFANEEFCRELVKNGLNDILFSLHGPNSQIHDNLTGVKGSFEKLIKAITNMKRLNIRCRSNTVVNGVNYKFLGDTAELLANLGIRIINFILFNPIVEAQSSDSDMNVTYEEASHYLKVVIDKYKDRMERITVRYIPFCVMQGYEMYVTNTPQIQYDPDEWDYYWRTYFRNGPLLWLGSLCLGFLIHPSKRRLFKLDWDRAKHEALKWSLAFKNKVKSPECKKCAYDKICDGLWRDYAKKIGFNELKAIKGEKIDDPTYFMRSIVVGKDRSI
jgi:MoaA/NifB/PqqE/SkfB family radical SAM enzyme